MRETYIECRSMSRPLTVGLSTFCLSYRPKCSWTEGQSRPRLKIKSDKWPCRPVFSSTVSSCQLVWMFGLCLAESYLFRIRRSFSMHVILSLFTRLFPDIWMMGSWKCRTGRLVCNWPKRTILQARARALSDTCAGCLPIKCIFQDFWPWPFYILLLMKIDSIL